MKHYKVFKVLTQFAKLITRHPVISALILLLTTLFIAISSYVSGVWQIVVFGVFIFVISIVVTD